jgi:hypothetical protein
VIRRQVLIKNLNNDNLIYVLQGIQEEYMFPSADCAWYLKNVAGRRETRVEYMILLGVRV